MAWAIITIYTFLNVRKWIPKSYLIGQHFIPVAKKLISKKTLGGG